MCLRNTDLAVDVTLTITDQADDHFIIAQVQKKKNILTTTLIYRARICFSSFNAHYNYGLPCGELLDHTLKVHHAIVATTVVVCDVFPDTKHILHPSNQTVACCSEPHY